MGYLQGLEGVANDRKIDCLFIESGKEVEVILRNEYAATTGQQNGALNVWKDDDGNIRVEAMRHYAKLDAQIVDDIEDAVKWVDCWLPQIK